MISARGQLAALLRKELRLELRTRQTLVAMVLFAVVAMIVFQFGIGIRAGEPTELAAGILWVTLALTAVLAVGRSFVAEREQGVLDGLLVAPVPRPLLVLGRAIAIAIFMSLLEIVAIPLAVIFFVDGGVAGDLVLMLPVCALANTGIGILGALLGSMTVFAQAREMLLPLMFLPALVPLVIAAAGATHAILGVANDMAEYRGYVLFLAVYSIIFALVAIATYEYVFDD